ncbi:MAG TPA: DNA replication/repair protein RecF [Fastidiosipila sp.]|nr:DNA replication/repair protein RecF [Fastidiosipila sp.]
MRLSSLGLETFRNYEAERLAFENGIALFYGQNAQGKTNILEAVFLCTCARSHRTGKDSELVKSGHSAYQVDIEYVTDRDEDESLTIRYDQEKLKRTITYNGIQLNRVADLMGLFHAVIFAPEDLSIVKDGPAERRRFLDLLISQIRPRYFRELSIYQQTLHQRNKLLKQIRDRQMEDDNDMLQLDIWDEQLAKAGAYVMATRQFFAKVIETKANVALSDITGGKEALSLRYRSFGAKLDAEEQIATEYLERLKTARRDDLLRGSTSYGPHRDDLEIALDDKDVRAYASQGQQRSITLALRIAELGILHEESGEAPVLLLDDVMSELDVDRRTNLLTAIEGYQVLMTCTDLHQVFSPAVADAIYEETTNLEGIDLEKKDRLSRLGTIHFYKVEAGNVHFRGTLN